MVKMQKIFFLFLLFFLSNGFGHENIFEKRKDNTSNSCMVGYLDLNSQFGFAWNEYFSLLQERYNYLDFMIGTETVDNPIQIRIEDEIEVPSLIGCQSDFVFRGDYLTESELTEAVLDGIKPNIYSYEADKISEIDYHISWSMSDHVGFGSGIPEIDTSPFVSTTTNRQVAAHFANNRIDKGDPIPGHMPVVFKIRANSRKFVDINKTRGVFRAEFESLHIGVIQSEVIEGYWTQLYWNKDIGMVDVVEDSYVDLSIEDMDINPQ